MANTKQDIRDGKTSLGVEFGSTRIKAVLIDSTHAPVASGSFEWENRLEDGVWTYHLDDVWAGLQAAYRGLADEVRELYGETLQTVGSIGFSAMMHGYLAFGAEGELLVPFRTWRNTMTAEASEKLTRLFDFPVPQRWSIAHLYQAILNKEAHLPQLKHLTTLAGYVHWKLTGEQVLGVGEASGMFPIDSETCDWNARMAEQFDGILKAEGLPFTFHAIMPRVLSAGEPAGTLTAEGAALLDPSGTLRPGIPLCPPEGDAGTGMAATNAVAVRTGNVSAGTSVFAMLVLEKPLSKAYSEIDMVTTPDGKPVAMVHCNNCTSDLNAWVGLFREFSERCGMKLSPDELFGTLYRAALEGDPDCGGLFACNYFSGEPITGFSEGRPLVARTPESRFTLPNLMRAHLYSALATLSLGMEILIDREQVRLDRLNGHGGLFKTPEVGQRMMAAAANVPVAVLETAGEGGAWGIALLAAYLKNRTDGETLPAYLNDKVFAHSAAAEISPDAADRAGFVKFLRRYEKGMEIERAAVNALREDT